MADHHDTAVFLRPLPCRDPRQARHGRRLAGGWLYFTEVESIGAGGHRGEILPIEAAAVIHLEGEKSMKRLTAERIGVDGNPLSLPIVVAPGLADGARAIAGTRRGDGDGDARGQKRIITASRAHDGNAVAWQPADWQAIDPSAPDLPKWVVLPPPSTLDTTDDALHCFRELVLRIDALEAQGVARSRLIVDLGRPSLAVYAALALFHGLGCAVLLDVDLDYTCESVSAAAAVVAAGQGIQFVATAYPAAVSAALDTWLAGTTDIAP